MIKSFFGSMTARIFIILALGTFFSAALVMALASYERTDLESHMRMVHTSERVEQIILMLNAVPKSSRGALTHITDKNGIKIDLSNSTNIIGDFPDSEFSMVLRRILGKDRPVTVIDRNNADCPSKISEYKQTSPLSRQCQTIFTTLSDGSPIRLDIAHHDRHSLPFQGNFVRNLLLYLTAILLLALLVAHIATKPLRRLAQAARDLGHNIEHPPLPENTGTNEVKQASLAFNSMQSNIRNHIQERTYMLAAIAHDLQTPLTRLRLRLEKVSDEDLRARLITDLSATLDMVKEGLDFARSTNTEEPFELVDVDSLIEAICNDATDSDAEVSFSGKLGKPILACPHILRRCINNLLDNAIKYGGSAHLTVHQEGKKAIVTIIDGGPGIPEEQLETVFQPFKRIDGSRSRNSGGTGLGLTIARIIADKHHGSIKLSNMGKMELGLVATLELPISY